MFFEDFLEVIEQASGLIRKIVLSKRQKNPHRGKLISGFMIMEILSKLRPFIRLFNEITSAFSPLGEH